MLCSGSGTKTSRQEGVLSKHFIIRAGDLTTLCLIFVWILHSVLLFSHKTKPTTCSQVYITRTVPEALCIPSHIPLLAHTIGRSLHVHVHVSVSNAYMYCTCIIPRATTHRILNVHINTRSGKEMSHTSSMTYLHSKV